MLILLIFKTVFRKSFNRSLIKNSFESVSDKSQDDKHFHTFNLRNTAVAVWQENVLVHITCENIYIYSDTNLTAIQKTESKRFFTRISKVK